MNRAQLLQRLQRQYRQETGHDGPLTTLEVARWTVSRGYLKLPEPKEPMSRLADEMSRAWRQEIRRDELTKRPYRVNHAVSETKDGKQMTFWGDIDHESRPFMQKSLVRRREQIVGDCTQLTFDADHFNSVHREDDPIIIPLDFTEDVEERKFESESGDGEGD